MANRIYGNETFERLLTNTINNVRLLMKVKGGEYSGDIDRLANFRRNATSLGLRMEQVWGVYAGKHWDSITTYISDISAGRSRVRSEPLSGRCDDLIVYLILLKAMLEEAEQDTTQRNKVFPERTTGGNSGAWNEVKSGQHVIYMLNGRTGILNECLQDGDAEVTWDDGTSNIVKWRNLAPSDKVQVAITQPLDSNGK